MGKNKNVSENVGLYKNEELILEEQDIKKDHKNLQGKNLDTKSRTKKDLSERISQVKLLKNELSSFLKEVKFSNQEFAVGISVSNLKYNHSRFQNNNSFYFIYN